MRLRYILQARRLIFARLTSARRRWGGVDRAACPVDAPKTGLTVEAFDTPPEVIEEVERLMAAAGIELAGWSLWSMTAMA